MTTTPHVFVVGFDGSPDSLHSLRFAARQSAALNADLRVVIARGDLHTLSRWADEWTAELGREWADIAAKELAELGMETGPEIAIRDGRAAEVLIKESAVADVVVVGSRGHGAAAGMLLGSVSEHLSRYAQCPVVVVRGAPVTDARSIVVGLDGSDASFEALELALAWAEPQALPVRVIHSRTEELREHQAVQHAGDAALAAEIEAREATMLARLAQARLRFPGVPVVVDQVDRRPQQALVEASRSAALLVVGSRGRGAFAALLLGSVSSHVLREAHCPVVIVR